MYAVSDPLAEIENGQMFRHPGDQGHIVIDDEDGQSLRGDAVEQIVQHPLLAGIEACGGLVEQQHGRIGRPERAQTRSSAGAHH